jgi:hypothetical protein
MADQIETLPVEAVAVVLDSIARRGPKWSGPRPLRRRLIAFIGQYPGGACISDGDLAVELGCSRGGLVRALGDLRARGVVVDLVPAAGRRPKWLGLGGDLEDWDVPWLRPVKHVICDAFHGGHHRASESDSGFVARQTPGPARDEIRSRAPEGGSSARLQEPRFFVARQTGGPARDYGSLVARQPQGQRATKPESPQVGSSSSADSSRRSVLEEPAFKQLAGEISERNGWKAIYGGPREELHRLVDAYGIDPVRRAAFLITDIGSPNLFVIALGDKLACATVEPEAPPATNVVELPLADLEPEPAGQAPADALAAMRARLHGPDPFDVTPVGHDGDQLDFAEGAES